MAQIIVPRKAKQQIVMKVEATYGVDVFNDVYVLTDVIQAVSDSIRFTPQIEEIPNLATAGALGRLPSAIGTRTGLVTFDMVIRGTGVAYSATVKPEADLPLRGCGLAATLASGAGAETMTYVPTDTHESMTIYVVQEIPGGNAVSAQLVGCCGNVRATGRAGGPMRYTFTFQGTLEEEKDLPYVQPAIKPDPALPTLRSANFHLGVYGPCVDTLSFDMANQLRRVPCANHVSGSSGYMIADREPMVEADPQMDREADSDIWDSMEDATPLKQVGWTLGQTQYNKVEWHIAADDSPGGQIIGADWTDRDGVATRGLRIRATLRNAPNTDFKIVYA
jgi:hypothetical protein